MKKITAVLIASIFSFCVLNAQAYETLTNSDITKMAKASLSDELIIDMIQSSPVNFDLSESSVNNLKAENISSGVIEAMKAASTKPRTSTTTEGSESAPASLSIPSATEQKHEEKPINESAKEAGQAGSKVKAGSTVVTALGYTTPIKGLVEFYEQETDEMSTTISEWDKEIKLMLMEAGEINDQIIKIESDLREKKNSSSGKYGPDILLLKKKLGEKRTEYKKVKEKMTLNGQNIIKSLTAISKKQTQTISKNYSDACRQIIAFDANPASNDKGTDIVFKKRNINDNATYYISPATEMLYWHQNEIDVLQKLVTEWNIRVKDVISKDTELSKQLEPLSSSMLEYKANPKKYKKEISALKKQMGAIENERKKLNAEMENDSENLSGQLKLKSMEAQNSVRERIADIIENINYTYQEKLNL